MAEILFTLWVLATAIGAVLLVGVTVFAGTEREMRENVHLAPVAAVAMWSLFGWALYFAMPLFPMIVPE